MKQTKTKLQNFVKRIKKEAYEEGFNAAMNTKQWDADIEKGFETDIKRISNGILPNEDMEVVIRIAELRTVDEEIKRHMYNLWSLSGGKIGKKPPEPGA